jgi:transposase
MHRILTDEGVGAVWELLLAGKSYQDAARIVGVSPQTVKRLASRESYREVTEGLPSIPPLGRGRPRRVANQSDG